MADLKAVARVVRWAAESMVYNLSQIPADKLDWKPTETSKSALQVAGEAANKLPVPPDMLQRVVGAPVDEGIASDPGDHGFFDPFPGHEPVRVLPVPPPERGASLAHFSGCQQEIQD